MLRKAIVIALSIGVVFAVPDVLLAAGRWQQVSMPAPSDTTYGLPDTVSCSSMRHCVAVGPGVSEGGISAIDNRGQWRYVRPAAAYGDKHVPLYDVRCLRRNWCVAVGTVPYTRADGTAIDRQVAERWNGSEWKQMRMATTARGGVLLGVDCASTTFCVASGYRGMQSVEGPPLIETFSGSRWVVATTPHITGNANLYDVSCPAVGNCYVVGTRKNGWPQYGLIFHLAHGHWTKVTNPPDTQSHQQESLDGISCPSKKRCVVVGYRDADPTTSQGATAAWRLLHGRWRVVNPPIEPDYSTAELRSVSCLTTALCVAVGNVYTDGWHAYAMRYTFNGWHFEQLPSGDRTALFGVSCLRTSDWCFALGSSGGGTGLPWAAIRQ